MTPFSQDSSPLVIESNTNLGTAMLKGIFIGVIKIPGKLNLTQRLSGGPDLLYRPFKKYMKEEEGEVRKI